MRQIGEEIEKPDGDVISLIRKFLVRGIMVDGMYRDAVVGTPQGGNLSPRLSNVMHDDLDKELKSRRLR